MISIAVFYILQESELQLRRQGSCVVLVDLELPHLVRLEEDPLRTEIMLYRVMVKIFASFRDMFQKAYECR